MKKAPKLCFALSGHSWVSINAVKSGLVCNCQCPACGAKLIARKGSKQQHHFAHYRHKECSNALETTLHLFGKSIIAGARHVMSPDIVAHNGPRLKSSTMLRFDKVQQEAGFNSVVIDVLLENNYEQLAVELKVTHSTTNYKQSILVKHGLACLEIDLMSIYQNLWAMDKGDDLRALKERILYDAANRKWLFHPKKHKWEYWALKQAVSRKIIHSQQSDYHHYHVFSCPKNKRFVRGGFRDGQSYARVFQDCLHCKACREIVYEKQWVAYKQANTKPMEVLCLEQKK